jgi:hypothetical protein
MLIVFGMRSRFKVLSQGTFFCPQCGGDRHYAHKQARRWFTVFFIPLIPLKVLGEVVECQTCKTTFKPAVLAAPTTSGLQEQLVTAYREAAVWLLRGGSTGRAAAIAVLSAVAGRPWSDAELDTDLQVLDVAPMFDRLVTLSGNLTEQGKEQFLTACTEIAAGGGVLSTDERQLIDRVAAALSVTPAHARGVIDQTLEHLNQS